MPDAFTFSLGDTACPATPGTASPVAAGTLAGMDATRVFLDSGEGFWPKAGGSGAPFMPHGAGARLTLNGSYYWNDLEHRAVVVTDAGGAVVRTIPLASPTNSPVQLAPAGDAGVYVLTRCLDTKDMACPASATETIELIPDAASNAQTVVAAADAVRIDAIDAAGSVLIWAERDATAAGGQFKKRDASNGEVVPLETPPNALPFSQDGLLIAGDQFFAGINDFQGSSRIERRALADGALIDTFRVGIGVIAGLAYDSDLYFTQPPRSSLGPGGNCPVPGGLFRIRVSDHTITQIDGAPRPDRVLIDGDVLYYTHTEFSTCCFGNGSTCPPSGPPPSDVRCYRQR